MANSVAQLLTEREGTRLDFKRDLSSRARVLETVCSFLNTAGGTLVVGVEDGTRTVVGVPHVEKTEQALANSVMNGIEPQPTVQIEIATYEGHDLLLLRASYTAGPFFVKAKGKERGTFVRVGGNSIPASSERIAELERARRNVAWDQEPMPSLGRDQLNPDAIKQALSAVGEPATDAKLRGLGILADHAGQLLPTRAGIILFGHERELHFPDAQIRCARFRGTDKSRPIAKSSEGTGTILDGIEAALGFLERNTDRIPIITGRARRREVDPYPPVAVREVLNNAVAHADYAVEGASIFLAIFTDRLEISSPGTWPPGFSLEDFRAGVSLRRNKAISRVLMRLGIIEGYGSGYDRVVSACRDGGYADPEWIENGPQIKVVLRPHPASGTTGEGHAIERSASGPAQRTTEERQELILRALDELERPNATDLRRHTGIAARTLERDLSRLRAEGLIEFVGKLRAGFYQQVRRQIPPNTA